MVHFKRKPVQYVSPPAVVDDCSQVWVIEQTNEVFDEYEKYLKRMDFYKQKRFICEITGHSGLTFFEALESETTGSKEIDESFPESLKEPVLRGIQFSTTSRMDSLVDQIYEDFKSDYYPGEKVTAILENGERYVGRIRDKTQFPELRKLDGTVIRKASVRYFIRLFDREDKEAVVDDEHIVRDRKVFSKQILRSFIKNMVSRDTWNGAPWLVKADVAERYRIETNVPPHLQYENKLAEKHKQLALKKDQRDGFGSFHANGARYPELKPKGPKPKSTQTNVTKLKHDQLLEWQRTIEANPDFVISTRSQQTNGTIEARFISYYGNGIPNYQQAPAPAKSSAKTISSSPIKYPIEDLKVVPKHDGTHRPCLKFLCDDPPTGINNDGEKTNILMESVGLLLETWETLNVYCEVFYLDSFTFDDFVEAMRFYSDDADIECELFVEIHCAVLKILVNGEKDQDGQIQIDLPSIEKDEDDEEDDDNDGDSAQDSSVIPTPIPEPTMRVTRSSLAKAEAAKLLEAAAAPSPPSTGEAKLHRAADTMEEYGWIQRLQKRDFRNGGWQMIMVGLLYQISMDPKCKEVCDEILSYLVPLDIEPTQEAVRSRYSRMDINLRVKALQIICMLTLDTRAIRAYMEDCSNHMTELRKEKIEYQRDRKALLEELRQLHEERKLLQPEQESPTPPAELKKQDEEKVKEDSVMVDEDVEDATPEIPDTDDEEVHPVRLLRHGKNREAERKRRLEEERARKAKAAAAAAKQPKGSKQFVKVVKKIEAIKIKIAKDEEEIAVLDEDLRQADCPRLRVLGKDRFWNRYYWLERNAMPYGGLPTSSTASSGYSSGCVWVQGPDDIERLGFIELSEDDAQEFQQAYQMTIVERKRLEEGPTSVSTARQWGYYDEPDSIDALIGWLDARGERELKLRKELKLRRDKMVECMGNRKKYLADNPEDEEEEPTMRITTRGRTYVSSQGHRCFKWHNSTAVHEIGHLHVDQPIKNPRKRKAADDGAHTRARNKQGKLLTRQGTRYDF